jgi:hypothetical protein
MKLLRCADNCTNNPFRSSRLTLSAASLNPVSPSLQIAISPFNVETVDSRTSTDGMYASVVIGFSGFVIVDHNKSLLENEKIG